MQGKPLHINTRDDYDRMHAAALSGGINPADMLSVWRGLLAGARIYVFDRILADGEAAGPSPDYIVMVQDDGTRRQERLADDPFAMIHRLGYTEAEVESRIAELEKL